MSSVSLKKVVSTTDKKGFLNLPYRIYEGNEHWCPPLLIEAKMMLDKKKHPFFKHGDAEFFIARDEAGKVVGRICASDDPLYREKHNDNVACFGMFESIDDQAVADALLNAAFDWVKAKGRSSIMGPIDFSANYQAGLLVEGFDRPQRIMMTYHQPYYKNLLETWGAGQEQDMVSWSMLSTKGLHKWRKKVDRLKKLSKVTIRPFNRKRMKQDTALIRDLVEQSLGHQWGYVRPTDDELRKMRKDLDPVPPDLIMIAEDAGKPVGVVVSIPDFNLPIRKVGGRLTKWGLPIGLVKLMLGMRKIDCARMAVLGVLPDYRFEGIAERLILESFEIGRYRHGYGKADMGWTLDQNDSMRLTVEKVAGPADRRYRVYRKAVGDNA